MKNRQGFTLVEILFVLSLIIIVSAITVPRFFNVIPRVKLEADAEQLAWVLRGARQEAINSGIYKSVVFYEPERQYTYKNKTYQLSPGIKYAGVTFKEIACRHECYFTPDGQSNGGTATLTCGTRQKSVIVLGSTGRIRMETKDIAGGSAYGVAAFIHFFCPNNRRIPGDYPNHLNNTRRQMARSHNRFF